MHAGSDAPQRGLKPKILSRTPNFSEQCKHFLYLFIYLFCPLLGSATQINIAFSQTHSPLQTVQEQQQPAVKYKTDKAAQPAKGAGTILNRF